MNAANNLMLFSFADLLFCLNCFFICCRVKVIEEHKRELVDLFEVDKMLPRTLLALMDLEGVLHLTPQIPFHTDASVANIRHFIKSEFHSLSNGGRFEKVLILYTFIQDSDFNE